MRRSFPAAALLRVPGAAAAAGRVVGRAMPSRARVPTFVAAPFTRTPARSLFVKIDTTPNPDSLKFVPEGKVVLPEHLGNGMHFSDVGQAKGSKLVRRLLKVKEITGVFLGRDFISINKHEDVGWAPLKPIVLDAIMDAYAELETKNVPLIEDVKPSADTVINPEDDEVVAMIKELLETRIRPAVQEDGGDIFFEGFDADTGIVKLRMAGSCVGCPSSTATLRNGVENMLTHYIPEVKGIEQVKAVVDKESDKELQALEERIKKQEAAALQSDFEA